MLVYVARFNQKYFI